MHEAYLKILPCKRDTCRVPVATCHIICSGHHGIAHAKGAGTNTDGQKLVAELGGLCLDALCGCRKDCDQDNCAGENVHTVIDALKVEKRPAYG